MPSVLQYSAMPLGSAYGTPGPPFEYRYAGAVGDPWSPATAYTAAATTTVILHAIMQSAYACLPSYY